MTHTEFVKTVTENVNKKYTEEGKKSITNENVKDVINSSVDVIVSTVKAGDKLTIPGLGTFESAIRAAREGRNPSTGGTIHIPEKTVPKFKAAKAFKDAIA